MSDTEKTPDFVLSDKKPSDETDEKTAARIPPMPEVNFATFALSLASSGLAHLGEVPNPESGKTEENLSMAKYTIDVLSMLREKTRNNLEAEEIRLMEGLLYELRMKYVVKSK
ncbi:hypothetical protein FACS1894206_08000 [Deltaproteobacteria bacterium]|nr:hypothetical protein FACS1894206_08000 [Deltaproteobacteria bacterium]